MLGQVLKWLHPSPTCWQKNWGGTTAGKKTRFPSSAPLHASTCPAERSRIAIWRSSPMLRTLRVFQRQFGLLIFAAFFAFSTPQALISQTVAGNVRESNGTPVRGARVVLTESGVAKEEVLTDGEGNFSLTAPDS